MKNHPKRWSLLVLALALLVLLIPAVLTAVIDPYFHYHAPLEGLNYPLHSQRYQNDGIVKHFDYDALITGTSMAENFKTSEFDSLFGANAIKVTYSGGTYEEITANLKAALKANPGIKYVLYAMDEWFLFSGKDLILADGEYPTYLYDDSLFNDVKYLFNKEIFFTDTLGVLEHTRSGKPATTFDEYSSWVFSTGAEYVFDGYDRPEQVETPALLTQELAQKLESHLRSNMLALAQEYPDTQFFYFFPPYSIVNWDLHQREGTTRQIVEGMALATQILLEAENIQVFSFYDDFDLCTDLDNYRDMVHYSHDINSLLLRRMANGEYRLTKENSAAHWEQVLAFYESYDYESLFPAS